MKRGRIYVGNHLRSLPTFQLPDEYQEVWSSPIGTEFSELIVEGPFPDWHDDGEFIQADIAIDVSTGILHWRWMADFQIFTAAFEPVSA